MELSEREKEVLTVLQRGIPPLERPFGNLALPEPAVVDLLRRALDARLARRFGGVFDARRLGYRSVLCAVDAAPSQMEAAAALVAGHPGVTHCYERRPLAAQRPYPALWFTLALPHDGFEKGLADLQKLLAPHSVRLLPALRRFKIDVVFDLRTREEDEQPPLTGLPRFHAAGNQADRFVFTGHDRALVRLLGGSLPVTARPYDAVAGELGIPVADLLQRLRLWLRQGVLRRIGVVLNHRRAGFRANGMCVWPVNGDVIAAGRRVAARPEVTHCYQRPRLPEFQFDLYAMIHTGSPRATGALFDDISAACGLSAGELFFSLREYKKSSMRYFSE